MEALNALRNQVREGIVGLSPIRALLEGKTDRPLYTRYLTNVWHYAQHSAQVIGMAGVRSVATHPPLADYLLRHAQEELGHEKWALADLESLGVTAGDLKGTRPVPACAAMIGYEYYVAGHGNPVGLFGWLFVLESMGDDLGRTAAKSIRSGLGTAGGVQFLAGHGEADEDHTREIVEQIEAHVHGADRDEVHHVAGVVASLYVRMFAEICG